MNLEKELREMKMLLPTVSDGVLICTYNSLLAEYEKLMPSFGLKNKHILMAYVDILYTMKKEKERRGIDKQKTYLIGDIDEIDANVLQPCLFERCFMSLRKGWQS